MARWNDPSVRKQLPKEWFERKPDSAGIPIEDETLRKALQGNKPRRFSDQQLMRLAILANWNFDDTVFLVANVTKGFISDDEALSHILYGASSEQSNSMVQEGLVKSDEVAKWLKAHQISRQRAAVEGVRWYVVLIPISVLLYGLIAGYETQRFAIVCIVGTLGIIFQVAHIWNR